jgi:hypothetical protein
MENWKDGFYAALLEFTRTKLGRTDATEVVEVETETQERGYCETCSYSTTVIVITYKDSGGRLRVAEWEGSFSDLISSL